MSVLEVHLLAGDPALLAPDLIHGQKLAALCGADFRCVPAYWLSSQCGRYSHNFLADNIDDNRVGIFARSLVTDYVRGARPLLVIPALVDEPALESPTGRKDWGSVLSALAGEIRGLGVECVFSLHLLAFKDADAFGEKLARLKTWLTEKGLTVKVTENAIKELQTGGTDSERLECNFLSGHMTRALAENCKRHGVLVESTDRLQAFVVRTLKGWEKVGLQPTFPLDDILMDRLTEAMVAEAMGGRFPALAGKRDVA